jgi:hypothetical protein
MMPTFPPPPLSFRTAGFPQYGWKAGISDSAFTRVARVKPAPGIPRTPHRFASALRVFRNSTFRSALCQNNGSGSTPPFKELTPLPQRPSLRSGFCCPSPSTLNRPHASHSQAHPVFAAWRLMPDALAVLVRLGDPRVVPCFRCALLLNMPPSETAGSPLGALAQFFPNDLGFNRVFSGSALPSTPVIRFKRGGPFAVSLRFTFVTACRVVGPLGGSDQAFAQPQGLLLSSFRTSRSPFSSSSIATAVSEQFHRWYFQPLERQLASLQGYPSRLSPVYASTPPSRTAPHDSGPSGSLLLSRSRVERWRGAGFE